MYCGTFPLNLQTMTDWTNHEVHMQGWGIWRFKPLPSSFLLLIRDVRWVPLLCVWKINPKILRSGKKSVGVPPPSPHPPPPPWKNSCIRHYVSSISCVDVWRNWISLVCIILISLNAPVGKMSSVISIWYFSPWKRNEDHCHCHFLCVNYVFVFVSV